MLEMSVVFAVASVGNLPVICLNIKDLKTNASVGCDLKLHKRRLVYNDSVWDWLSMKEHLIPDSGTIE